MEQRSFLYKRSTISYRRYGQGPRNLVCFHGYGEDADSYGFLHKHIGEQYTIFSIDLPFHGNTRWEEGFEFTSADLQEITREVLLRDRHAINRSDKFSLIGFSLGGRMVLDLYQSIPGKVEKLFLLAPDGLKVNFWYWLSTQTWLGNKFFSFTMKHPEWFFGFLRLLNKLKLVNASIFKFVQYYIGNKEVRQLLYARWTTLRKIKPRIRRIKGLIKTHSTKTRLLYGKHDRIILSSVGEKFRKGIEEECSLSVIESGHQVLHDKHAADIIRCLAN